MSGHSKWHSIRRGKAILDNKRGQVFTKIAREISIAAREGNSGDATLNFRLRLAVQKAKAENMPADNIDRAIKRGLGGAEGGADEEVTYEGHGPGGSAIIVQAFTNNRNRTASEIRNAFTKGGGNLGESGAVGWMFQHVGVLRLTIGKNDPEEMTLNCIDAGAEDVQESEDELEVYTTFENWKRVEDALRKLNYEITNSEAIMKPTENGMIELENAKAVQLVKLLDRLEDLDDVQNVFSNVEISDEVAEMV
jgi:YebC/PmpR family DNA-binding regulatory protein